MKVCIVVGARRLLQNPLLEAVKAVEAAGGQVSTITWFPVTAAIVDATTAHVELRAVDAQRRAKPARTGIRPVDRVLRRVHKPTSRVRAGILRRWDRLRRKAKLDGQAALVHRLLSQDARCRALLAEADVIVAGDPASIRAVWFVLRRRPEIEAISGLGALRSYLSGRALSTGIDPRK